MRLLELIFEKLIVHHRKEAIFSPPAKTIRLFSAAICPGAVKNTGEERYELLNLALVRTCECVCTITYVVIPYCSPLVLIITLLQSTVTHCECADHTEAQGVIKLPFRPN